MKAVLGTAPIDLTVAGVGGVPSTGVDAVVLNVTTTSPTASSWLTVWPAGQTQPNSSNLNYEPGNTVANLVIVKVGTGGIVKLANAVGSTHCVADVVGYFVNDTTSSRHVALSPARVLDTRDGTGRPGAGAVGRDQVIDLQVNGVAGVPSSGATAVLLNLTVTAPTSGGWAIVYPSGQAPPNASNLNFVAGQTRANLVLAKIGANGKVAIINRSDSAHYVADVAGYFV